MRERGSGRFKEGERERTKIVRKRESGRKGDRGSKRCRERKSYNDIVILRLQYKREREGVRKR